MMAGRAQRPVGESLGGTESTAGENRVRIEPVGAWVAPDVGELWRYRHVLVAFLRRDFKIRYRQTLFGPLWFVLAPIGRMGIFTLVFGRIAQLPSDGVPYPLFIYAALLPWELFAGAVQRCAASMIKYQSIIPKVYFPRLLIPLAETLSILVDFAATLLILLAMMYLYGYEVTARIALLPVYTLVVLMAALSIGTIFAALQVRYRDVTQFTGYLLQAWSFATPVAYSSALAASAFSDLGWIAYQLNPMFAPVEGFRWMFLGAGTAPGWALAWAFALTMVGVVVGAILFERTNDLVIDSL